MSEVKLSQFDCGNCPNITDGCFGRCEKANPEVVRMFANWNMQEYFQHKDGDIVWFTDFDAQRLRADTAEAELSANRDEFTRQLQDLKRERQKAWDARDAAEQRIADTTAKLQLAADMLDNDERGNRFAQVLRLAIAVLNPKPEAARAPYSALEESYDKAVLLLHKWINNNQPIAETIEFLNPNPEAESHEKH